MNDRHQSERNTQKKQEWFARLQQEFEDVGIVDRTHCGYELVMDNGSRRFKTVKEMREFATQERAGVVDWLEKGNAEWREEYKALFKLLVGIKKDCISTMARYPDKKNNAHKLAKHLIDSRLFSIGDEWL